MMLEGEASFSEDGRYRFTLYRRWAEVGYEILFICLNPSTADAVKDDPTVRRCVNFAKDWGYRGVWVGNIFALRSTTPKKLYADWEPVGMANDLALREMAKRCSRVVYAWGSHGRHLDRGRKVIDMMGAGWCFGLTKIGEPRHPLYLGRDAKIIELQEARR